MQCPASVLPPAEIGTAQQQEFPVANVLSTLHTLQFTSEELHLLVKAVEDHYLSPAEDNEGEINSALYDLRDALQKPIMADYQVKWLERKVDYHKREVAELLKKATANLSAAS